MYICILSQRNLKNKIDRNGWHWRAAYGPLGPACALSNVSFEGEIRLDDREKISEVFKEFQFDDVWKSTSRTFVRTYVQISEPNP